MSDLPLFRCRCSAISKIMSNSRSNPTLTEKQEVELKLYRARADDGEKLTENQFNRMLELEAKELNGKKVILSDTCVEYLGQWYAYNVNGRIAVNKESLDLLPMKKGKLGEPEAFDLLCVVDGEMYDRYKERIENQYLTGELDVYLGSNVYEATRVVDIKMSWDEPIYIKKCHTGVDNGHTEQVQGYGDITGARELYIAECLVCAPKEVLEEMAWKVLRKINAATFESPEFVEEWKIWLHSMTFKSIPYHQRVFKKKIEPFTEFERQRVYDRVKVCRDWLEAYHEQRQKLPIRNEELIN